MHEARKLPAAFNPFLEGPEPELAPSAVWTCESHGVDYGKGTSLSQHDWTTCDECSRASAESQKTWEREWRVFDFWASGDAGIPRRFRTRTRANWSRKGRANERIGQAVDGYAAKLGDNLENGSGLVLLGPPGLGKTHLLVALVADALAAGVKARYAVWPDVLAAVKATYNLPRGVARPDILETLQADPLLALDELALKPSASEFDHGLLFELLDFRYREELPTLIASNVTADGLAGAVGERIADRLTECCVTLVLSGTSQRAHAADSDELAQALPHLAQPSPTLTVREHYLGAWREREITRNPPR
jgi:DNA replication protein DnaC